MIPLSDDFSFWLSFVVKLKKNYISLGAIVYYIDCNDLGILARLFTTDLIKHN